MNALEIVFVASSVINILLLVLVFLMYNTINTMKIHLTQVHSGLGALLGQMSALSQVVGKLSTGFADFVDVTGTLIERIAAEEQDMQFEQVYRTVDGKYSASSLDELLDKIKKDGADEKYISDDDIDRLKRLFEEDDTQSEEEDE